jgi:hypothetical protein
MTGTRATTTEGKTTIQKTPTMATPYHTEQSSTAVATTTTRVSANEDDFDSEWKEYKTYEEAKENAPKSHAPKIVDGFYLTSIDKTPVKLRRVAVMAMMAGKKTANMCPASMKVGKVRRRLYIGYADEDDPRSASFFVRTLTKLR